MANEHSLLPQEIITELNKFIIGQDKAKRAVAVALRNRWRRMQLPPELRREVAPKNILMIGPTGVGKTEIARRLATLVEAPFVKVEATKFTEVGYVGRDVESIIRDLAEVAVKMLRERVRERMRAKIEKIVEEKLLDALVSKNKRKAKRDWEEEGMEDMEFSEDRAESPARRAFRRKLREGELEDREITISMRKSNVGVEIMGPPGMDDVSNQIQSLLRKTIGGGTAERRMKISDARRVLMEEVSEAEINEEEINSQSIDLIEQHGIVFLDEIDKITRGGDERGYRGIDASREGVQRDLLPIIEGSTVKTRYGMVKTDHILFIASGAFHLATPADLIPELQGRLPIRVTLNSLGPDEMEKILREPDNSLILQYKELLKTEGLSIEFDDKAIRRIAEIACEVNENMENIGARRLHTLMERLLEEISFKAKELATKYSPKNPLKIKPKDVNAILKDLLDDKDLTKYIL